MALTAIPADYKYATCRAEGHHWKYKRLRVDGNVVFILGECRLCPTTVEFGLSEICGTYIYDRKYTYPDDYRLEGYHPRSEWRTLWVMGLETKK